MIELSDSEATVMLELKGVWRTSSLPLLSGPLWLRVVAPDTILSMGQKELFHCVQANNFCQIKLLEIELFDHSTVCKQMACLIELLVRLNNKRCI